MNYLSDGGIFVVQTLTGLIVLALNLRFLMQVSRANYYNPIAQGLVKATNPGESHIELSVTKYWSR